MLNQQLLGELKHEAVSTRKILERVPQESFDWKPHPKSRSIGELAAHIAEITRYTCYIIEADELNFAKRPYQPPAVFTTEELMKSFEENLSAATASLETATDEPLRGEWTLRRGETILLQMARIAAIRVLVIKHIVHHRGQLSVYLRLLDIPVPGIYGPSADERF